MPPQTPKWIASKKQRSSALIAVSLLTKSCLPLTSLSNFLLPASVPALETRQCHFTYNTTATTWQKVLILQHFLLKSFLLLQHMESLRCQNFNQKMTNLILKGKIKLNLTCCDNSENSKLKFHPVSDGTPVAAMSHYKALPGYDRQMLNWTPSTKEPTASQAAYFYPGMSECWMVGSNAGSFTSISVLTSQANAAQM